MNAYEQYIAFTTLVSKEIRRYLRIWTQTLLPSAITMSLYYVIFGNLIGSRIGEMGGRSYMEFVVPGLIMMAIVTNSYSNVVSSFFGAKFSNSVEELLVSPVPNYIILWGLYYGRGIPRPTGRDYRHDRVTAVYLSRHLSSGYCSGCRNVDVDIVCPVWLHQRRICQ